MSFAVEENEKTPNKRRKLTDTAKKQMAPRDPYADPRPSTSAAADQEIEEVTVVQETSEEDTESDMEDDERSSSSPEPEVESQSQELAAHNMIKNKKNVIEDSEEETEEEISEHKNKTPRRSKRKIENSDDSKAAPGNSAVVKRKQELQRLSEVRNRKIKATQKRRIEKGGEISSDDECEDLSESVDKVKRSLDFETITHISETDSEKENSQEPLGYGESGDELSSYESDFIDDSDGDEEMEASTVRNNFEEEMRNIISNFDRSNDTFRFVLNTKF